MAWDSETPQMDLIKKFFKNPLGKIAFIIWSIMVVFTAISNKFRKDDRKDKVHWDRLFSGLIIAIIPISIITFSYIMNNKFPSIVLLIFLSSLSITISSSIFKVEDDKEKSEIWEVIFHIFLAITFMSFVPLLIVMKK